MSKARQEAKCCSHIAVRILLKSRIGGLHCRHVGVQNKRELGISFSEYACVTQKKICSHSLHKNRSKLPEEKNLIVPVHQHGRHDVTCKPSISSEAKLNENCALTCSLNRWLCRKDDAKSLHSFYVATHM